MCPVSVVKVYEFILKINLKHNNYYKTHIAKKKIWLASIFVKRKTWSGRVFYDNFKNVGLMCRNLPHWELEPPKNAIESIFFFNDFRSHDKNEIIPPPFLIIADFLWVLFPMSLSLSLFCQGICLHLNWSGKEFDWAIRRALPKQYFLSLLFHRKKTWLTPIEHNGY